MKTLLVSGSSGLIARRSAFILPGTGLRGGHGVATIAVAIFLGPQGDTRWSQQRLQRELPAFTHA